MKKKFYLIVIAYLTISSCSQKSTKKQVKWRFPPDCSFDRRGIPDSLKPLCFILDTVYYYDQVYRRYKNFDSTKKYAKIIYQYDSINLKKIIPIIEKHGIISVKDIGICGHLAIIGTIQHANLSTQEKYLPLFREALKKKAVLFETLALLEDRVEMKNHRLQIYGTQVMQYSTKKSELYPVINVDSLDQRRLALGFKQPIAAYLKQFGIKWDLEKYKKELPTLTKKYNVIKDSIPF